MINKKIMVEICKRTSKRTAYRKISMIQQKAGHSISRDTSACVLASQLHIDIHKLLQDDEEQLSRVQHVLPIFNFENRKDTRQQKQNSSAKKSTKDTPYDYPLSKFNLDTELVKNCKIHPPYRTAIKEAALVLETRIRDKLKLGPEYTGVSLVKKAKREDLFKRPVRSEAEGLLFTYMGVFQWIRNPPGHRKIHYTKEEAIKIVLYIDYLIKLLDDLINEAYDFRAGS